MILDILKNQQKPLSAFLISLLITTIVLVISHSWWKTAYDDQQIAKIDLNDAKEKYYTAINQKQLLKEFEEKYKALEKMGVVGDERRLNWVDNIEKITTANKIPYLKYKIEKRQSFSSPELIQKYPGIELFKSTMKLDMQLLHEGDLYTILNALQRQTDGLFDTESCTINRNPTSIESLLDSATNKNFSANCEINWYTMQKKAFASPEEEFEDI